MIDEIDLLIEVNGTIYALWSSLIFMDCSNVVGPEPREEKTCNV